MMVMAEVVGTTRCIGSRGVGRTPGTEDATRAGEQHAAGLRQPSRSTGYIAAAFVPVAVTIAAGRADGRP